MPYDRKKRKAEALEKRSKVYSSVKERGPIGPKEISRHADLNDRTVGRICQEYVAEGVFRQLPDRTYALSHKRGIGNSTAIKQAMDDANLAFLEFVKGFWNSTKGFPVHQTTERPTLD